MGFGERDRAGGNQGIHDDVSATALFLDDGREQVLIVGYDLCFLSRDEADRVRGAIGRELNLRPSQILLNFSHSHSGPRTGTWYYAPRDPYFVQNVIEPATLRAAAKAKESAREVTIWVGEGETRLPLSRRRPNRETGRLDFGPNPAGAAYRKLPVVLFKDPGGKTLYALFSVSAHPSSIKGNERAFFVSADYPGAARRALKRRLGLAGAVFLQGAGGDSKASVNGKTFLDGTWEDVFKAGEQVAEEVIGCISKGLVPAKPAIVARSVEMRWPMQPAMSRSGYAEIAALPARPGGRPDVRQIWAADMVAQLDQGYTLPTAIPITAHGIRLGAGFRMIAIEGEMVAELGHLIRDHYSSGVTMPLGYSNGCQLYLPTSKMMDEGGYEVESYWEYRFPAPLAKGVEEILKRTLRQLERDGVR